jgi:hypothetical protein
MYYWNDQIKDGEIGYTCRLHRGKAETKIHYQKKLKG